MWVRARACVRVSASTLTDSDTHAPHAFAVVTLTFEATSSVECFVSSAAAMEIAAAGVAAAMEYLCCRGWNPCSSARAGGSFYSCMNNLRIFLEPVPTSDVTGMVTGVYTHNLPGSRSSATTSSTTLFGFGPEAHITALDSDKSDMQKPAGSPWFKYFKTRLDCGFKAGLSLNQQAPWRVLVPCNVHKAGVSRRETANQQYPSTPEKTPSSFTPFPRRIR